MNKNKAINWVLGTVIGLALYFGTTFIYNYILNQKERVPGTTVVEISDKELDAKYFSVDMIPKYSGKKYAVINNNIPFFGNNDLTKKSFENYSELDELGRCGVAYACVGKDIMPTESRGEIGSVRPTGWHTVKYDCIADRYLYNRCHLIAYELTGENANEKNLITGTRFFNVEGMLPFENKVASYVRKTGNHVMYRVTPIFADENLVADGVLMEAYSVEDNGKGIAFCVFCYNVQPGVKIDYRDGSSEEENDNL